MKIEGFLCDVGRGEPAFVEFPLRDVNPLGGTEKIRWISAPNQEMRVVHERLIQYLRRLKVDWSSAKGARSLCSPVRNVKLHRHHRFFYLTDVHNAYGSVDGRLLAEMLFFINFGTLAFTIDEVYEFLKKFCLTPKGGLITGAPASPDLFNLYCAELIDGPLREHCACYGITYTRYLDDFTFSSDEPIGKRKRRVLNEVIRSARFVLSDKKTKVLDLEKKTIEINGVGLELGGRIFLPRRYARKLRGFLHAAIPLGGMHAPRVHGMMGAFHGIYREVGTRVRSERQLAALHEQLKRRVGSKGRKLGTAC